MPSGPSTTWSGLALRDEPGTKCSWHPSADWAEARPFHCDSGFALTTAKDARSHPRLQLIACDHQRALIII